MLTYNTKDSSSESAELYAWWTYEKMNVQKSQKWAFELDPFWTVIFKKGKIMNGRNYVLELSYNEDKFYIFSFDIETSEQAFICISDNEAKTLLQLYGNDYE